jgi:large subunit ribosomal protein L7/L12
MGKPAAPAKMHEPAPVILQFSKKDLLEDKEEVKMAISRAEVVDYLANMTVLELSTLIKELEEKFGVSAAAPVAVAAVGGAAAEAAPAAEEKTEFDVVLTVCGPNKIQVIKEVRAVTNLGLKEAKEAVENVPTTLKEAISKAEAEEVKKKLEAQGATIEIK